MTIDDQIRLLGVLAICFGMMTLLEKSK